MVSLSAAPSHLVECAQISALNGSAHPRRLSAAQRRAQLQEVACDAFARHGYHHISMDDIANNAAVTKPVLYKHFPSKLDLYLAILKDLSRALKASAFTELECAPKGKDAQENAYFRVKAVFDGYARFVQDTGVASSLLFESDVTRDSLFRDKLQEPNIAISANLANALAHLLNVENRELLIPCNAIIAMAIDFSKAMLRENPTGRPAGHPNTDALARFAWGGISQFSTL